MDCHTPHLACLSRWLAGQKVVPVLAELLAMDDAKLIGVQIWPLTSATTSPDLCCC